MPEIDPKKFRSDYYLVFHQKQDGNWYTPAWEGCRDTIQDLGLDPENLDRDFKWVPMLLTYATVSGYRVVFTPLTFSQRIVDFDKTIGG